MSLIKVQDPANIILPVEIGKKLGLKGGDTMLVTIEEDRVVLEKSNASPVDDAFGLWPEIQDSAEFINQLREEWEERGQRLGL